MTRIFGRLLHRPGKDPENPDLLRAIDRVAISDNPRTRHDVYDAVLKSTLMLPTIGLPETQKRGWQTTQAGQQFGWVTNRNAEGGTIFLAFTDTQSLIAWRPAGCAYTAIPSMSLFPLLLQNNAAEMVINPAGPTGGRVSRKELEALATGAIPEPLDRQRTRCPSPLELRLRSDYQPSNRLSSSWNFCGTGWPRTPTFSRATCFRAMCRGKLKPALPLGCSS